MCLYVLICINICIYIYIYMYTCTYMHLQIYTYMHTCKEAPRESCRTARQAGQRVSMVLYDTTLHYAIV